MLLQEAINSVGGRQGGLKVLLLIGQGSSSQAFGFLTVRRVPCPLRARLPNSLQNEPSYLAHLLLRARPAARPCPTRLQNDQNLHHNHP